MCRAWLWLLLIPASARAADWEKVSSPIEVRTEVRVSDSELEGKVWNRWTSDNFVVCSINDQQAEYLHLHLEQVKTWILTRWGLPDIAFSKSCKLICVDDPQLYDKLFHLTETKVEVRRDQSGQITETVIFLLLNRNPAECIPLPLTEVCLAEFERTYQIRFGWWCHRGMAGLNDTLPGIRQQMVEITPALKNGKVFTSKGLLTTSAEEYQKLEPHLQKLFDQQATYLCLLLRKEFGQELFLEFLKTSDPERGLKEIYRFESFSQFDRTLARYIRDLSGDLTANNTPDLYLQIRPK